MFAIDISASSTITNIFFPFRRIHITDVVRQHIGSDYEVEDGHGYARDKYLADNAIKTYFVIADPKRVKHVSAT